MRRNRVSIILAVACVGFILGSAFSFMIPYQNNEMILTSSNISILDDLEVPLHTRFPLRSFNQSIDIFLDCTNGFLDIVVMKSIELYAWVRSENYSAYYEVKNVTHVMTTVEINPPYFRSIDIILQTNYGDANMSVSVSRHWTGYDVSTGVNSLLLAIPFAIVSYHYATKKAVE